MTRASIPCLLAACTQLVSCRHDEVLNTQFCADQLQVFAVNVLDGTGAPIRGLEPAVTNVRTGVRLDPMFPATTRALVEYTVITNHEGRMVSSDGDVVRFSITFNRRTVDTDFRFAAQPPCYFVTKLSGPEQITVR